MYIRLASAFSWTWEYIDEYVTVPRLLEIAEYWKRVPPLHEAFVLRFAQGRGESPGRSRGAGVPDADENHELLQELFGAGFELPADAIPRGPTSER